MAILKLQIDQQVDQLHKTQIFSLERAACLNNLNLKDFLQELYQETPRKEVLKTILEKEAIELKTLGASINQRSTDIDFDHKSTAGATNDDWPFRIMLNAYNNFLLLSLAKRALSEAQRDSIELQKNDWLITDQDDLSQFHIMLPQEFIDKKSPDINKVVPYYLTRYEITSDINKDDIINTLHNQISQTAQALELSTEKDLNRSGLVVQIVDGDEVIASCVPKLNELESMMKPLNEIPQLGHTMMGASQAKMYEHLSKLNDAQKHYIKMTCNQAYAAGVINEANRVLGLSANNQFIPLLQQYTHQNTLKLDISDKKVISVQCDYIYIGKILNMNDTDALKDYCIIKSNRDITNLKYVASQEKLKAELIFSEYPKLKEDELSQAGFNSQELDVDQFENQMQSAIMECVMSGLGEKSDNPKKYAIDQFAQMLSGKSDSNNQTILEGLDNRAKDLIDKQYTFLKKMIDDINIEKGYVTINIDDGSGDIKDDNQKSTSHINMLKIIQNLIDTIRDLLGITTKYTKDFERPNSSGHSR